MMESDWDGVSKLDCRMAVAVIPLLCLLDNIIDYIIVYYENMITFFFKLE